MLRRSILPIACGLLALVVAVQVSIAGVFRSAHPQMVLLWAPSDADAQAKLASLLVTTELSGEARNLAIRLARTSIQRSALNPVALRTLGLAADGGRAQDTVQATRLFKEAERLSRRDRPTQLWLVESAMRRGDIEAAIGGIDVFLRSSVDRSALFSLLIEGAASNPKFAASLKAKLREKPEWAWPFAIQLVSQGPNAEQIVDLTRDILDPKDPEDLQVIQALVARLSELEKYELGWRALIHFQLGERERIVDGGFEKTGGFPPFAWTFSQEADLWAERQVSPKGRGQVLRLSALSGRGGEVARQLVRLEPGRYRIQASFGDVPTDRFERPELRMRCAGRGGGQTLLSLKPDSAGPVRRTVGRPFSVPEGCRFQWLTIFITGEADQAQGTPWIDDIVVTDR